MVDVGTAEPALSEVEGTRPDGSQIRLAVRTLRPHPPHRIGHPIRRVHPIQILGHLRAQETACHRVCRVPLNPRSAPIFHGDQHPASIGAVMWARGMDDLLHNFNLSIIRASGACNTKGIRPRMPQFRWPT